MYHRYINASKSPKDADGPANNQTLVSLNSKIWFFELFDQTCLSENLGPLYDYMSHVRPHVACFCKHSHTCTYAHTWPDILIIHKWQKFMNTKKYQK